MRIPASFRERYCAIVDDSEAFLSCLARPLPRSLRINTLKADAKSVRERFASYGIDLTEVPWYGDAFVSDEPDIGSTLEHFTGAIYMQELVSMLPPLLIRDELGQGETVLDGCAAPGSKTTQLAALMRNQGTIIANDIAYGRIKALKFNLEKVGALNTIITNRDLRSFPPTQFGHIILDVPCSAEGTMRKNPDHFSAWSERDIEKHSRTQKQLILKGFDLLRIGGSMVYSTCTFSPEENEETLDWLLKSRPDARLEPISFDGLKVSEPLSSWKGQEFDSRVRDAARIWPHHNDTGGFFLAKVRK